MTTIRRLSRGFVLGSPVINYRQQCYPPPSCSFSTSSRLSAEQASKAKPDLKKAAQNKRPQQIILGVCILVAIYMYPMIFKPLFGRIKKDDTEIEEQLKELQKRRPEFMPEWTSPFGPKKNDD